MNWLGRVFVVLILILSVVFMSLTMMVYATHKNWREVIEGPSGLKKQLADATTENEQLKSQHMRRVEELDAEKAVAEQQAVKLAQELDSLVRSNAAVQTELDQQRQVQRENIAAVAATQDNNKKLSDEVTGLRDQIRTEEQKRDEMFKKTLAATEAWHQINALYEAARERLEDLTEEVAGMTSIMDANGLDPKTDPKTVVPTVYGQVQQIRRSGGAQFVEVSIGADDGLKAGNTVEVYRGSRYLGRADVVSTSPDKSVAKIDRRYQQGQIQEGDSVATRLQL